MKTEDRIFFRTFLVCLAALVVLALVFYAAAAGIVGADEDAQGLDPREATLIEERIKPVGKVAIGEPPAADTAAPAANAEPRSGQQIVETFCQACHATGVPGAPQIGDTAAWKALLDAEGLDMIVAEGIKGEGAMPPRGGSDATDDEFRAAVEHMLRKSGL